MMRDRFIGEFRHKQKPCALHECKQTHPETENKRELQRRKHDVIRANFYQAIENRELVGEPLMADDDALGRLRCCLR